MAGTQESFRGDIPREVVGSPEWGFIEFQGRIGQIYQEHDAACGYGPDTMFAKLIGNTVTLSKAVRKGAGLPTIDRALTNVFVWTATLANEAHLPLFDVLLEKFLLGCPRCHKSPCNLAHDVPCIPTDEPFDGQFSLDPSLNGWQEHFAQLYPNNFKGAPQDALKQCSSRLFEEAGELLSSTHADIERDQTALSHHDLANDKRFPWRGEFADTLAWSFAVAEALKRLKGDYKIGTSLKEKYFFGCPYCKQSPCRCLREVTVIEELSKWELP